MIIHASTRTDIAYYYADWLINRLKEGSFYLPSDKPNIMIQYDLKENPVEKLFLHTKNPYKLITKHKILEAQFLPLEIITYFTMYDKFYEPQVKERNKIMDYVRKISEIYGEDRVSIGYDHVFRTIINDAEWHISQFEFLCRILHNYVSSVYVDFSINGLCIKSESFLGEAFSKEEELKIRSAFKEITDRYGLKLKDKPSINTFGPDEIDIGEKDACPAMCRHCGYITNSRTAVLKKGMHNPESKILIGSIPESTRVRKAVLPEKEEEHEFPQVSLFDFFGQKPMAQ